MHGVRRVHFSALEKISVNDLHYDDRDVCRKESIVTSSFLMNLYQQIRRGMVLMSFPAIYAVTLLCVESNAQQTNGSATVKDEPVQKKTDKPAEPADLPADAEMKEYLFQNLADNYVSTAVNNPDRKLLASLGEELGNTETKDANTLNSTAWSILTDGNIKVRDIKLALKLSKKACDLTDYKAAEYLDTYALALYQDGNAKEAVEKQGKAVALMPEGQRKREMITALQKYQSGK